MPSVRSSKRTTRVRAERARKERRHQRALRKLARRAAEIEGYARATTLVDPYSNLWFTPESHGTTATASLPTVFVEDPNEEDSDPFTDYISLPEAEFERIVQAERSKMETMRKYSWDWAAIEGGEALWLEHILAARGEVEADDDAAVCLGGLKLEDDINEIVEKAGSDNALMGAGMANAVKEDRSIGWQ
ncbi:hypothetical protein LTS12_004955 [Elasticomyces elasticus]|nr:hypothetical protein LTS12_004955 [Elasticomyces elasticus]